MQKNTFGLVILFYLLSGSASAASKKWFLGLTIGKTASYLNSFTGIYSNGSQSATASASYFATAQSIEYGLDFWVTSKDNWGFISGIQYQNDFNPYTTDLAVSENFPTTNRNVYLPGQMNLKAKTDMAYIGTVHRWDMVYVPIGLVYGQTSLKYTPLSPSHKIEIQSGFGLLFGVGWIIDDQFAIEYISRSSVSKYTETNGAEKFEASAAIGTAALNLRILL